MIFNLKAKETERKISYYRVEAQSREEAEELIRVLDIEPMDEELIEVLIEEVEDD